MIKRLVLIGLVLAFSVVALAQAPAIPAGPSVLVLDAEYHVASCPKLRGQSQKTMSLHDAILAGVGPCPVCQPNKNDDAIKAFVVNYTVAIGRELVSVRRAERASVPFARITERRAREIVRDAGALAKNDLDSFTHAYAEALRTSAPDFSGLPLGVFASDALVIAVVGPLEQFITQAEERVRKFEPLDQPPLVWSPQARILVGPLQIDSPDIEKIIVQRNGVIVPPLQVGLVPQEMVTRMGAKRMIHGGGVAYPLSAFEPEPGVTVTVIAIPATGSNITRTFDALELRAIQ